MRNLYLRIFLTFWAAMVLVLTFTFIATLWLTAQRTQHEQARQAELAREASSVLDTHGTPGLRDWLARESSAVAPDSLFVLDRQGHDLLGRHVPEFLESLIGRTRTRPWPPRQNWHDVRLLSQLVSPTDETYSLSLLRARPRGPFGIFNSIQTPIISAITTLLASAIVCFLLARYLSDPIRHLRAATHSIADGDLGVRVSSLFGNRRDELALLAYDFDAMAERLRALLESQRQLLRDVSHELRSPLARLQIALGLARRPNANLQQEFDRIEQETQRLDELIGEILSLSRLDDPSRALLAEPVNLQELLETVADNARLEAEARAVRIELTAVPPSVPQSAPLPIVQGDRELLFRALENVVRNAVRFSPAGAAVQLLVQRQEQQALIQVSDRGPGVPAELLERIFEPFFRVGKAREAETGGFGIGLAITARVAALHGGAVHAHNLTGAGLRVDITLPLHYQRPRPGGSGSAPAPGLPLKPVPV